MPIYSFPDYGTGIPLPGSSSSDWDSPITSRKLLTNKLSRDIKLLGFTFTEPYSTGSGTTREGIIEITTGKTDNEVVIVQYPYTNRNGTQAAYQVVLNAMFPEPILIAKGTRLRVRLRTSELTGTIRLGFKFFYEADGPLLTYESSLSMNNFLFVHGSSNGSEVIR